ncbi:MAG: tRNA lysidine(34) synthetase TilS [Acidobacteria bacterium]|nr:tRNA lysidine(34) synthetase TilS [Acidobacteriota bacterium]
MTQLERKLIATLRRLALAPADKVLIGVSGGADSMALLDAMQRMSQPVCVAHLNHGLRGDESDADEQFVRQQAEAAAVKFFSTYIDVATQAIRQNLEATGRAARYEFFAQVARTQTIPFVLTAHTHDDQTETLLMRWLRGTGATGLRGIHERRPLCEGVKLIRPLLAITRAEVLEHCAHYGVPFRTDSSNLSDEYTRNRVRHQLLPLLREFNPQFDAALQRGAGHWQADADCLEAQARDLSIDADFGPQLSLHALTDAHPALRQRVLRAWVGPRLQLTAAHGQALERFILSGQSGRTIQLPKGWRVTREFKSLLLWHVSEAGTVAPPSVHLAMGQSQGFGAYEFFLHPPMSPQDAQRLHRCNATVIALREAVADGLWLRARQPGDAYVPVGRTSSVKLKTLMMRERILLTERAAHPLLVAATGEIIWSPRLPMAAAYQVNPADEPCVWVTVH